MPVNRVRSLLRGTAALGVIVALSALRIGAAETSGDPDIPVRAAVHDVAEFGKTKAAADLQRAIRELASAKPPRARGAGRDRVTKAWFALFRALDGATDHSFDPEDVPQINIIPPPSNGVVYFAGVDPSALKDPAARARYETALRANHAKAARFRTQYALRDLGARAVEQFALFRRSAFTSSDEDRSDFARLLSSSNLTAARKASLDAR